MPEEAVFEGAGLRDGWSCVEKQRREAQRWLRQAEDDFDAARLLLASGKSRRRPLTQRQSGDVQTRNARANKTLLEIETDELVAIADNANPREGNRPAMLATRWRCADELAVASCLHCVDGLDASVGILDDGSADDYFGNEDRSDGVRPAC